MEDIMLSVVVITYNQENYVRQCIESILQQEVNFKYEILVGDDASSDHTVAVLEELRAENPGVIRLLTHESNVGAARNIYDLFMIAKGKYLTRLEGDDFWEKTGQLQFSVDFLEQNSDFIAISRSTKSMDMDGNIFLQPVMHFKNNRATIKDYLKSKAIGNQLYRNIFKDTSKDYTFIYTSQRMLAELALGVFIVSQGDIYVTNERWEVKRTGQHGASNYNSLRNQYQIFEDSMEAWDNIQKVYQQYDFSRNRVRPSANIIFYCVSVKDYGYIKKVLKRLSFRGKFWTVLDVGKKGYKKVLRKIGS